MENKCSMELEQERLEKYGAMHKHADFSAANMGVACKDFFRKKEPVVMMIHLTLLETGG